MNSILQTEKECYLTGAKNNLDKHHIFFGSKRKVSEENGFWVWLHHEMHIHDSPYDTPHNNREVDWLLKMYCQMKFEETHTREEFIKLIGRSYL